jgi:alpha-1,2-mannosyltransferase
MATRTQKIDRRKGPLSAVPDHWVSPNLIIVVVTLSVGAVNLAELLKGHLSGFYGSGYNSLYNEGVYYGAATQLVHGVAPYRDFVFVQPPGILLILTPFAFFGRLMHSTAVGLEMALVATKLVVTANVAVIGWLLRRRALPALILGMVVIGCQPETFRDSASVNIEPFLILGCLIAVALLFDGETLQRSSARWIAAGVVFGLATTTKLWGAVAVVAICLIAARERERRWVLCLTAAVLTFAVVSLPFLILAPSGFIHDVITTQAGRARAGYPSTLQRLAIVMIGVQSHARITGAIAICVLLFVGTVFIVTRRRRITALEGFGLLGMAGVIATFLASPSFYAYYGAFSAFFEALVLSSTIERIRPANRAIFRLQVAAAFGIFALVGLAQGAYRVVREPTAAALSPVDTDIPLGNCVVTDSPSIPLLADRFTTNLAGCPSIVDWQGVELSDPRAYDGTWLTAISHTSVVILTERPDQQPEWSPLLRARFAARFPVVHRLGFGYIYETQHLK